MNRTPTKHFRDIHECVFSSSCLFLVVGCVFSSSFGGGGCCCCLRSMLRCAALLLAEVTKAASTSGAAAATKGPTKRKSKWIDRHSYKVHHNGKDAFSVFDQPSCELCHVRFRYKQDYEVHKDSLMHRDRLRWEEKTKWFQNEGEPVLRKKTEEEWDWYVQNVLKPQAARQNVEVSQLTQQIRRAIHVPKPGHSRSVDYPSVVQEIVEPLQQRWPSLIH